MIEDIKEQNKPKISVIIPIYNVEKYLRQCLDSIVNQTLKDLEIICIDDGSPDNCGKIIDEYALKDSRIKTIHKENGGYGKAVNTGFDLAKGEYIGIVESDDWCEPDMYEKLYNRAKKLGADVCKCDFKYYYGNNNFKPYNSLKTIANEGVVFTLKENPFIMKYHVSIWSAIYKKSYLEKYNIRLEESKSASYQDMPFAALVYSKGAKITILHDNLINYRAEDNMNSSTIRKDGKLKMMPIMCGIAKQYFIENDCWEKVKEIAYRHFYNCAVTMWFKTEKQYKKAHYDELQKLFGNIPQENVKLIYFKKNQKKIINYIIKDDYKSLMSYYNFLYYKNLLKNFRRKILRIRFNKNDKYILFLGHYIWKKN